MPGTGIRRFAIVLAVTLGAAVAPGAAEATTTYNVNCAGFGSALVVATSGDTIVLSGMCTGAAASYALPGTANLTIEGAATGTNGFDGTGASGPALSGGPNGLTLSGLTFQNYGTTAVRLAPTSPTNPYTFTNDTFSHNTATGSGGGLSVLLQGTCAFSATAVTVTGSTFDHNSAVGGAGLGGGGGAYLESACGTAVGMELDNNRFTNNTVTTTGTDNGDGGGLFVATGIRGVTAPPMTLAQNGNLFSGNTVSGSGGSYDGGGEYTNAANLTSTGDGFIGNALPGPTTLSGSSEGGGLATFGGGLCTGLAGVTSTASNLVAAGNTIGAPSGSGTGNGVEGAGVYVGCSSSGGGYHMTLINSTISGNTATGTPANAVAGIDGESMDHLQLENTILSGDTGGSELAGFGIGGGSGSVAAEGSDVCAVGSTTTPFAGTNNICAPPQLVDPAHGDVHETATSPTIDVGLNPDASGLSTDYYGRPRLELGKAGSNTSLVDAGASEFHPMAPTATSCSQIDALLTQAENGDVITIATMCLGGSFTIPDDTRITIQGAPTGTNGFDGVGAAGEALHANRSTGLTLRNLTIRNYTVGSTRSAVELQLVPGPLPTIDHVQFLRNTSGGEPGGLLINGFPNGCGLTGSLTLTGSTFFDNVNGGGSQPQGGGAVIDLGCPAHLVISGNQFTDNVVHGGLGFGYGGGLLVLNESGGQLVTAEQDHNVFRGNAIDSTGATNGAYLGGGESVWGVGLTSAADTFIDNSLPAPAGPNSLSEGAGLGITDQVCGGPGTRPPTTAVNLVAAGNTIGAPASGGTGRGAGVFAGCAFNSNFTGGALTLINSTISGNSLPGGPAGLASRSGEALTLSNSVIAGNTGAGSADIAGFGIGGGSGSPTVAYSDVCTPDTSVPLPGSHNMCADPKLAAASTGDVHETSASPTIDAGSNALVPAGLTTDAYGAARIFATKTCTALVDIGAAEFGTRTVTCPPPPPPPRRPKTVLRSIKAVSGGVDVGLRCTGGGTCVGTITMTTTEARSGKRVIAVMNVKRRRVTVTVGAAGYRLAAGKQSTLHLRLNASGKALLARFRKLPISVLVTQRVGKKTVRIAARKLTIRPPKPKKKR